MDKSKAQITAVGSYVPEKRVTNEDLERMVETNDEWIVKRTGIKERRIASEYEFTSDICVKSVENLMERYNKSIKDVDMVIVSTMTPDFKTPSVAALVQAKLGITNTGVMDLNAACAGFTYGLHVANGLITAGLHKKVLVIGAETMSKITDYEDRTTCILFGDGGGAAMVEYNEILPSFISSHLGAQGELGKNLYATDISTTLNGEQLISSGKMVQNGREVYKWAVNTVSKGMLAILEHSSVDLEELNWFIPHSANLRIIESICEKTNYPISKTLSSLISYGNTSAASIPLALDKGLKEGKIKKGDRLLLFGFGGGLTFAGLLIEWTVE